MRPNHYHALVGAADILGLLHELGRFHGRTSHAGNGEENARGHVGIDEAQPGGLEMGVVEGGLARGARAADEAGVGDALGGDGVGEGLGDVLLPDDVAETLRPIFSGDDRRGHAAGEKGGTGWDKEENVAGAGWSDGVMEWRREDERGENTRVTTADAEQTTVAAFRPSRGL